MLLQYLTVSFCIATQHPISYAFSKDIDIDRGNFFLNKTKQNNNNNNINQREGKIKIVHFLYLFH